MTLTKWDAWLERHPETLALDVPARSTDFDLEQMAIVVALGDDSAAYVVRPLREIGVINDTASHSTLYALAAAILPTTNAGQSSADGSTRPWLFSNCPTKGLSTPTPERCSIRSSD